MSRLERDRKAALAASEAAQRKQKQMDTALIEISKAPASGAAGTRKGICLQALTRGPEPERIRGVRCGFSRREI